MKFFFSCMYIYEEITSLEELCKKIDPRYIEIFLDTNICIMLRDFYREPNSIVNRPDNVWDELRKLLKIIEVNDLLVDFSIGAGEACRNKSNFGINYDKLTEMIYCIRSLFNMNYFEILEHSKIIKFNPPVKDNTTLRSTKMDSLEEISIFQNLLFVNYASLLKLFLLDNQVDISNVERMKKYVDFLDKEVNSIGGANLLFGYYYFGKNNRIKKLIHKTQNESSKKFHALLNAAIDLTFPTLVSKQFGKNNTIPVFVTGDEKLYLIFNSMKMRVMFRDGKKDILPPLIELDLLESGWSEHDWNKIDPYIQSIQQRRSFNNAINGIDQEEIINYLRILCRNLEIETNEIINR